MNCPKCGRPMQDGYIYSWAQPVQWAPDGVKPSFMMAKVMRGGVLLREKRHGMINRHQAEAYHCPDFRLVVAPTE